MPRAFHGFAGCAAQLEVGLELGIVWGCESPRAKSRLVAGNANPFGMAAWGQNAGITIAFRNSPRGKSPSGRDTRTVPSGVTCRARNAAARDAARHLSAVRRDARLWFWDSGTVVEIETEDACRRRLVRGRLQRHPVNHRNHMSRLLIGQDAGEIEGLGSAFRATHLRSQGRGASALSAIDLALWDLAGKAAVRRSTNFMARCSRMILRVRLGTAPGWRQGHGRGQGPCCGGVQGDEMRFLRTRPRHRRHASQREHIANVRDAVATTSRSWPRLHGLGFSCEKMVKRLGLPARGSRRHSSPTTSTAMPNCGRRRISWSPRARIPCSATSRLLKRRMDIQPDLRRCGLSRTAHFPLRWLRASP